MVPYILHDNPEIRLNVDREQHITPSIAIDLIKPTLQLAKIKCTSCTESKKNNRNIYLIKQNIYLKNVLLFHNHVLENTSINELKRFLTMNSLIYIPPVNNFLYFVLSIGYTPISLCFFMLKRNITSDFRYKLLVRNVEL